MKLCTKIWAIVTGYTAFLRIAGRSLVVLASFDLQTGSNFVNYNQPTAKGQMAIEKTIQRKPSNPAEARIEHRTQRLCPQQFAPLTHRTEYWQTIDK